MQVSVENLEKLEKKLQVNLPASELDRKIAERLKYMAKKAKIPGFRPGKVPAKILKERFESQARFDAMDALINESLQKALKQQDLIPVVSPSINLIQNADNEFIYTATFEVYPEIKLTDFKNINIEQVTGNITEKEIDNMIESLRKQAMGFVPSERNIAQNGDRVTINFKGSINGEAFEGGSYNGMSIELGSGRMISGFEDGIVGIEKGQTKTINVFFPENYQAAHLAGKAADFEITLLAIDEPQLPDLNEELFVQFGIKNASIDMFRAEIRKNMERELKKATKSLMRVRVMDALYENHKDLDTPKALIENESKAMFEDIMKQQTGNSNTIDKDTFTEHAKKRVALGLLVSEIVEKANIKVDKAKVDLLIDEIASAYQDPEQVANYYKKDKDSYKNLYSTAIEDAVVEHVLANANTINKELSYEHIVQLAYSNNHAHHSHNNQNHHDDNHEHEHCDCGHDHNH